MKEYGRFASFYDGLTKNVDYNMLAGYYDSLFSEFGHGGKIVLDLACGTGSLSLELVKKGYDVIATDISEQMLSEAMNKQHPDGNPIFLRQKMQELDMFGTIDAAVCSLDGINHLKTAEDVSKTFGRVSLFMNPGAVFVFDVNTQYKHKEILGDNTFVYDTDEVYCVWQNRYSKKDSSVEISLDFFEPYGTEYRRTSESFKEYCYSKPFLEKALLENGLKIADVYDGFTKKAVKENSQRIVFVCVKEK